jgi:hypothetical protein
MLFVVYAYYEGAGSECRVYGKKSLDPGVCGPVVGFLESEATALAAKLKETDADLSVMVLPLEAPPV